MDRAGYRACGSPLRRLMQHLDDRDVARSDGAAILELQGAHAAAPMPGDCDLFTGELFTNAEGRAPAGDGSSQLGLF